MKRVIFASLLLALPAGAAQAETIWVGNAFITAISESTPGVCADAAKAGDYAKITYRPAGVPLGNGADSTLAYVGQRSNLVLFVPSNTFRAGINYAGAYVSSQLNFGSKTGAITAWAMTPTTLDVTTLKATLAATFTNFYGLTGCTVVWRADLERAP